MKTLTPNKAIYNKNLNLFDEYLINFQLDIRRIVGKFKKSFHALTDEEVYSECNIHLLKNKEKIVTSFEDKELTEMEFKKIAYHYTKNEVVWSHYRFKNKAYEKRKLDAVSDTEDGPKTTFEITIDTMGCENEELDNDFDFFSKNSQQFFHVLKEYSYLLNENESKILSYLSQGLNQDSIAEKLNVTHQAISFAVIKLQEKLNAFFNFNDIMVGDSQGAIAEGQNALDNFFNRKKTLKISKQDRLKIKELIINHPKKYTSAEINKILFNDKFNPRQISSSITKSGLENFIIRKTPFSPEQKSIALKSFLNGCDSKEVASLLNVNLLSVRALRGQFVKENKLEAIRRRKKRTQ